MNSLKLGLLLLLTFFHGPSDQIKKQKLESQGKQRNYYLFVPASASQTNNPALLVLFHGSRRNGLSVRATESALKDRQFPIEVKIMKGHDHWYYDLAPEINEDAWSFLRQNTLTSDPHHTQYNPNGISASASGSLNEINALRSEAVNRNLQVIALDTEIDNKIRLKDKSAIVEIAKKQIALLDECARLLRNAAAIAENASKMKLSSRQQEYFSLLCRKRQASGRHSFNS